MQNMNQLFQTANNMITHAEQHMPSPVHGEYDELKAAIERVSYGWTESVRREHMLRTAIAIALLALQHSDYQHARNELERALEQTAAKS